MKKHFMLSLLCMASVAAYAAGAQAKPAATPRDNVAALFGENSLQPVSSVGNTICTAEVVVIQTPSHYIIEDTVFVGTHRLTGTVNNITDLGTVRDRAIEKFVDMYSGPFGQLVEQCDEIHAAHSTTIWLSITDGVALTDNHFGAPAVINHP
jgi:hypothetical protein